MILDAKLQFSKAQAVTVTAPSTDVLDLGAAGDALKEGNMYLVVKTIAAATADGAATTNISLQTSVDDAFTAPIILFDSGSLALAALTANTEVVKLTLPIGVKRFLRVVYTIGTGPLTAGTFDAFLTPNVNVQ